MMCGVILLYYFGIINCSLMKNFIQYLVKIHKKTRKKKIKKKVMCIT